MSQVRAGCCQPGSSERRWLHRRFCFSCAGRKKQGRRGGLPREMALKRSETKRAKDIFTLSVAWVPPPKAGALTPPPGNRRRLAGASPGEPRGLSNTYADHPAVPKIQPFFNIQRCEALCRHGGERNGKCRALLDAGGWWPEKSGLSRWRALC